MSTTINARPAKLRNGSWGARVEGTVREGDTVTITTSSGKSWQARVTKVLWTGEGVSLCATSSLDRPSGGRSRGGCACPDDCCDRGCRCAPHCNCRGGNIYDC